MSILVAVVILLTLLVTIDLALTVGIVRRLRADGAPAPASPPVLPPGYAVEPHRDDTPWPAELLQVLTGDWLVVLTMRGCRSCDTVRRELSARRPLGLPACVLVDPATGTPSELAEFLSRWEVDMARVAPSEFDVMLSIGGGAPSYPALILLRDGRVVESGARVRHLTTLQSRSFSRS